MASYTIELRKLCQTFGRDTIEGYFSDYQLEDYLTNTQIQTIIDAGVWSKDKLAKKIVNHYLTREIGFETVAHFKLKAKVMMDEIMEEKLPYIYTLSIEYNPLINVDYYEEYEGANKGEANSNSKSSGSGLSIASDTPQGKINKSKILSGDYASSTSGSESENSVTDMSTSEGTQNYIKHIHGNSGISATYQKMIEQYRGNIITVDKDIINELNDLFMGIY